MIRKKQIREIFEKYPLVVATAIIICYAYDNKMQRYKKLKEFLTDEQIELLKTANIIDKNLRYKFKKEVKKLDRRAIEIYEFFKEKYKEKFGSEYITINERNEISMLQSVIWSLSSTNENITEDIKNAIIKFLNEDDKFIEKNGFNFKLFLYRINKYFIKGRNAVSYTEKPNLKIIKIKEE